MCQLLQPILNHISPSSAGVHSSRTPLALPTHNNRGEEEAIVSETIVDSGCVRATAAEAARTHTDTDLFFLFIERSRPHLSGRATYMVQLPIMAMLVLIIQPPSTRTCRQVSRSKLESSFV